MTNKIPSDIEISTWYRETSEHPDFIEALTTYQKTKLLEYCKKENDNIFSFAYRHIGVWNETNFPKGLPEKDQLEHIVTVNQAPALYRVIKVLNALNYSWSFQEGIKSLNDKPEEASSENEKKSKLTIPQIALLHVYNRKPIPKPSSTNLEAQEIAEGYDHSSGEHLYNTYIKLQGHRAQRLNSKKSKNMIIDIQKVLHLLNLGKEKTANEDLKYLNDLLENNNQKE